MARRKGQVRRKPPPPPTGSLRSPPPPRAGEDEGSVALLTSAAPAISPAHGESLMAAENSDMRLVIAGAGGRMGRTLINAIAATRASPLPARSRRRVRP